MKEPAFEMTTTKFANGIFEGEYESLVRYLKTKYIHNEEVTIKDKITLFLNQLCLRCYNAAIISTSWQSRGRYSLFLWEACSYRKKTKFNVLKNGLALNCTTHYAGIFSYVENLEIM